MPYIVKRGKVDAGECVYAVGESLPEGVGDDAMVEAGSIEWLPEKVAAALAEVDLHRKSNRELREMCEERDLDAGPRMNKDELVALLESGDVATGNAGDAGEDGGD